MLSTLSPANRPGSWISSAWHGLRTFDRTRTWRVVMVLLLFVAVVQVLYWYLDQRSLIIEVTDNISEIYQQDILIANELLAMDIPKVRVHELLPHITINGGEAEISTDMLASLYDERENRMFRYVAETAFFLIVILAGISVVWKALSDETRIRMNQDNFLMLVSHEFKTPLASLQLAAETMLRRAPSREDLEKKLRRMLSDLQRMQNMVSKILDSARLQQGQVDLECEAVHLKPAIRKALNQFDQDPLAPSLECQVEVADNLYVDADPLALETVLLNILENAHEAMRPQGHGKLIVSALRHGDNVEVTIRDTGIGFAPQKTHDLFDKFYRTDDAYCGDKRGTGLGLYIVSRLMQLQSGHASASSEGEGFGAAFKLSWLAAKERYDG